MEAAGFHSVTTDYTARMVTLHNFDEMWSMLTIGAPPVKKLFDQVGEAGMDKIKVELANYQLRVMN